MRADIAHHDGKITAEHKAWPNFTSLTFRQGNHAMNLILPARMAACAAMIVEAFNAHMGEDPATIVAQGGGRGWLGVGSGGSGGRGGFTDHTEHLVERFIGDAGKQSAERLAEYRAPHPADYEWPTITDAIGPLDSAGIDLREGSPAMDMADTFNVEFDRIDHGDTPVGGLCQDGCIRLTDMYEHRRYLTHGRVLVTPEVAKRAQLYGWHVERGDGVLVVISRGAYEVRIPGENAITPGPSEHVE